MLSLLLLVEIRQQQWQQWSNTVITVTEKERSAITTSCGFNGQHQDMLSTLEDRRKQRWPFSKLATATAASSMIVICIVQSNCRQLSKYFFSFSFLFLPFSPFHFFFVLFHFTSEWVKVWQRLRVCALKWKEVERSALVNWLIDWPAACYR